MRTLAFVLLLTAHKLHDTTGASTKRDSSKEKIPDLRNRFGTLDVPEECKDLTYCTIKPPNYPEEQFNKMFEGVKTLPTPSLVMGPALQNRILGDEGASDDCSSTEYFDPIYQVRPKRDSEWVIVVQAPKVDYTQRVRLEICDKASAPCFNIFPAVPDAEIFCQQNHSKWEVLVANGTETVKIVVDLPTCCSCVYKIKSLSKK